MLKIKLKTVFLVLIFCSAFFTELKAGHTDTSDLTEAYDPKPMIMHNVLNAHEWHLFDYKDINQINPLLDGMYAYVAYDKNKNQLIISRDPQGEKSLYISG